jgi:hypothetical protein
MTVATVPGSSLSISSNQVLPLRDEPKIQVICRVSKTASEP